MPDPTPESPQPPPPEGLDMPLVAHLEELRRRLLIGLLSFFAAAGVSLTRMDALIEWLRRPADAMLPGFVFFSPTEAMTAYLKLAGLAGLALAMPVILWQVWGFVQPGLTRQERSLGLVFVGWGSALFALGISFAYLVLLPAALSFLLGIGRPHLHPMISIERYVSFVMSLLFWCGLVFELPLVLWVLARVGIVTPEWLRQQRPYAIVALVVIAAIVTPTTDIVNLGLLFVPLVVLYEISIIVSRFAVTARQPLGERQGRSGPSQGHGPTG